MANQQDQQVTQTLSQENLVSLNEEQLQAISGSGWNPFASCLKPSTTEEAMKKANRSIEAAKAAKDKADRHVLKANEKAATKLAKAQAIQTSAAGLSDWATQIARNAD